MCKKRTENQPQHLACMLKQFASEELGEISCFLPTCDAKEFEGDLDFKLNMYIA